MYGKKDKIEVLDINASTLSFPDIGSQMNQQQVSKLDHIN